MTLPDSNGYSLAATFKAAGDPMRLEILRIMERDSFGVLELCKIFAVQQPSMSHHLKVLAKAGLVATRREGNSIFYFRGGSGNRFVQKSLNQFFDLVDQTELPQSRREALEAIRIARQAQAAEFFRTHAERFREQQDLIAGHKDYGTALIERLSSSAAESWLEVGAGDGQLLAACAEHYQHVFALDISDELLGQAQQRTPQVLRSRIRFIHGDTKRAREGLVQADVVTCNMVLHHVPSPAAVVQDLAAMTKAGGRVIITDLDEHDQDWARTACGDLWLGFTHQQLDSWATDAGLEQTSSQFLALRNGFRVQIKEYANRRTSV